MRIVFNLQSVGLGNNGGSRTLIKCAETLQNLGHEVHLWCSANNYKWSKIKVPITPKMPPCDAIVATGYRSVGSTAQAKVKNKFYYIRGFELWQASEAKLIQSYKALNCIVNSEWLLRYMKSKGIPATLVYPGIDDDLFGFDNEEREPVLGGLFSNRHATKRHIDVIEVGKRVGCQVLLLNRDIKNPSPGELRKFYNGIKVWMSPSELEGLHNCPLEAGLCGAGLVVTDHKQGGVSDYAIDGETACVYPSRNLDLAVEKARQMLEDSELAHELNRNLRSLLKTKIGNREHNMTKMAKVLRGETNV